MKKLTLMLLVMIGLVAFGPVSHSSAQSASGDLKSIVQNLQLDASDMVREIANEDQDGIQRAYGAFTKLFTANRDAIKAKSAEAEMRISDAYNAVSDALNAGDLGKAKDASTALLKALNDAAEPLTGVKSGSVEGLLLVMQQMKAAARDLEQEASFKDIKGLQASYDAFDKLFKASESQINDKSPQAAMLIEDASNMVRDSITGGDTAKVSAAADNLQKAVDDAANLLTGGSQGTGGTPGMPTTGSNMLSELLALAGAALVLAFAGATLRRHSAH